jgi:hypothetical protein
MRTPVYDYGPLTTIYKKLIQSNEKKIGQKQKPFMKNKKTNTRD